MAGLVYCRPMKNALVICAHPLSKKSRVHRTMMEFLSGLPEIYVHDLYETYPYFHIDVEHERQLLKKFDLIVWQQPLYWFGMTPLLKLWCDEVLRQGFAYGPGRDHLQGKDLMLSLLTGGMEDPETSLAMEDTWLTPYQKIAETCGLRWRSPLILTQTATATQEQVVQHAQKFLQTLENYCRETSLTSER